MSEILEIPEIKKVSNFESIALFKDGYELSIDTRGLSESGIIDEAIRTYYKSVLSIRVFRYLGKPPKRIKHYTIGNPCSLGCLNNLSYPCENCGRVGGDGEVWLLETVKGNWR